MAIMTAFGFTIAVTGMGYAMDVQVMQSTGMRMQDVADAAALAGAAKAAQGVTSPGAIEAESRRVAMAMLAGTPGTPAAIQVTPVMGPHPEVTVQIEKSVALFFRPVAAQLRRADGPYHHGRGRGQDRGLHAGPGSFRRIRRASQCRARLTYLGFRLRGAGQLHGRRRRPDRRQRHGGHQLLIQQVGGGGSGNLKPRPTYDAPLLADPIGARITWPNPTGCDFSDGMVEKELRDAVAGRLLRRDRRGDPRVGEADPGLYVIKTGGLSLRSGGSIQAPAGVTIVLLDPQGVIDIGSQGSLEVVAPKTGPWANIAIAVKPQPTQQVSNMQGGGEMQLDGIVYLPSQTLHLTGGGEMDATLSNRMFVVNGCR